MSIGKCIVVVFILFAAFIGTLVTVCVKQDINLVSKEYYKEDLAYQEHIDRLNNTRSLASKPIVSADQQENLVVQFQQEIEEGTIELFCPSNPNMDREIVISPDEENTQHIDISELSKGMYRAKLFWTSGGKKYFTEEIVYL